jgi:hypothetical protein
MIMSEHLGYVTDPARSVECDDDGLTLAIGVNGLGDEWPWILVDGVDGATRCADDVPEHEQVGPLPPEIRERIIPTVRCGAPTTTTGEPCRNRVDRCPWHGRPPIHVDGENREMK